MNTFFVLVIRLILGVVFGILLTRVFHPEWSVFQGALVGVFLVAIVYSLKLFRQKKS